MLENSLRKVVAAALLLAAVVAAGCTTPIYKWPARVAHELSPERLTKLNEHENPWRDDFN